MKPQLLSTRLGITVGFMGVIVVLTIVVFTYLEISRQLDIRARDGLNEKLRQVEHGLLENYDSRAEITSLPHKLSDHIIGHDYLALVISAPQSSAMPLLSLGNEEALRPPSSITRDTDGYGQYMSSSGFAILSIVKNLKLKNGQYVTATLSLERKNDALLLRSYIRSATLSLPLILILVGGCGWWLVRRGLSPLHAFSTIAARISAHDLDHRIDLATLPGELKNAAHAINFMLDRLDQDIQKILKFSDDLAHELRSPLNNLMGKVQVTLSRERSRETYIEVMESCLEELDRMSQVISQMLFLVSANHPSMSLPFTSIDLREEAIKVADLFSAPAEDKHIALEIEGNARINGDRLMIQRAVSNLLSNAIRHSPLRGVVTLTLSENTDHAMIAVRNSGEGIAAEHLAFLFDRFYRVHSSRSRQYGGTGLGLAIVKTIMNMHGGKVTVTSDPGNSTVFTLFFPKGISVSAPDPF